jgi:hypothetical protein
VRTLQGGAIDKSSQDDASQAIVYKQPILLGGSSIPRMPKKETAREHRSRADRFEAHFVWFMAPL